ncbi:lipoate--protein ligase family protein [Ornithinimicrobium faecis]|uniref:Lipoate--protein ligase family protein n=1 Tax=Ornithinimicrobium faecis TaxID=2934158 RepID=A0ABY4YY75_9MICO|nr:lipoate--protein ligase family protein [Ornithinimicrobium sp. HY1793]USQ81557.1 lipoate--protein ligase family protein [Ornithinimicrobium sp. HY1793]
MELIRGRVAEADPALEMSTSHALLRRTSRGGPQHDALRIFRPTPMVAFGRSDANRPGFPSAAAACHDAGFTPVIRSAGGRAVACSSATLILDHVQHDPGAQAGMTARFEDFGALLAGVLRDLGIESQVGEVPGEFCPGAHSVSARGEVKLVGTAQRIVRDAWLFSSVVIFDDALLLAPLLTTVYDALGIRFDPASVGSVASEAPSVSIDLLEAALTAAYDERFGLVEADWESAVLDEAKATVADHLAEPQATER